MTVEILLFMAVGAVTIATAAMMLLSQNAVHSALFLIVNFIGVAFLYLMLEAPFLAMVQIAVYAGAIMVLFLFVIMLLGAEKTGAGAHLRRFRWMAPVAMALSLMFIITVGWALTQGQIDTQQPADTSASVRFIHAAPQADPAAAPLEGEEAAAPALPAERAFVLLVNGEVVDDSFVYGEASGFVSLPAGLVTLSLRESADGEDLVTTTLELTAQSVQSVVLAGDEAISFYSVPQASEPGLTLFNAYSPLPALAIGDLKGELFDDARRILSVGADELPFGTASAPLQYPADFPSWVAYVPGVIANTNNIPNEADLRNVVIRISEALPQMRYGENALVVIAPERRPDGTLRAVAVRHALSSLEPYGSAVTVGARLFTDYLLPFQLVAMLLLASMVGVIVITYRGDHVPKPSRATRRKVARPLTSVITSQTGADLVEDTPKLPERADQPAGD
jgi:NADH-quinone oxidoreductase subunit J